MKYPMLKRTSWKTFRNSGLLWFVNRTLHLFGWAIVFEPSTNLAYPARTKFRGFRYKEEEKGFKKVSKFMVKNADRLLKESE